MTHRHITKIDHLVLVVYVFASVKRGHEVPINTAKTDMNSKPSNQAIYQFSLYAVYVKFSAIFIRWSQANLLVLSDKNHHENDQFTA